MHINLRIVQTEVLGETSYVMSHQNRQGFTGEITEVKIDTPGLVTILEVFGAVVGVMLAPFTYGMSLMVTAMFEEIISSIASDIIFSAEKQAANSIMTGMGTNSGILRFHLPNIKKPGLVLQPQDIVVRKEGLYSWFIFYVDYQDTSTAYIDVVNYPKTYSDTQAGR